MPALAKPPFSLPRFVPHVQSGGNARAAFYTRSARSPKTERSPFESESLQQSPEQPKSLERLAHDARNVLSGLMLYGELLAMPGVLAKPHGHYAQELQGIARSTAQILEKIVARSAAAYPAKAFSAKPPPNCEAPAVSFVSLPVVPVIDTAEELRHLQPLLAAIAGPAIRLSVGTMPCAGRTALAVEHLTRVLVNLVRNAADAMPAGGHIRITAQYGDGLSFLNAIDSAHAADFVRPGSVLLAVVDNGPGIPESLRKQVFETGFSTRASAEPEQNTGHWTAPRRRGLGLSIVRNLVEAAGGKVCVACGRGRGARFEIHLPITPAFASTIPSAPLLPEPVPSPESHVSC